MPGTVHHGAWPAPRRQGSSRWWRIAAAVMFAAGCAVLARGQAASREYDLKAVFLYNFATFVDWPEMALGGADAPFVIGVLGDDPFGAALDEVTAGEKVKGRRIVVERYRIVRESMSCHILFISASEGNRLDEILRAARGRPILTVADMPRFVESGGIIGFTTGARLQLHVNATAARGAGLTISSKLLRVASVREYPERP